MKAKNSYPRELRLAVGQHFNIKELETLAFDLGINWDELAGDTLTLKCQSLIGVMGRNGRLPDLLYLLHQERPGVPWPDMKTTPVDPISKGGNVVRTAVWNALLESLWSKKTFLKPFKKQEPLIDK